MKAALADSNVSYIILDANITLSEYIGVLRTVEINGNNKTLTLTDDAAFYDPASKSVIVVQGDNVKISNLTIDAAVSKGQVWSSPMVIGLQVNDAANVTLDNMKFVNGHAGLYVNAKTKNTSIVATKITTLNNSLGGIGVHAASGMTAKFTTDAVANTHTHTSGKPAIWDEGAGTLDVTANGYTKTPTGSQNYYTKN